MKCVTFPRQSLTRPAGSGESSEKKDVPKPGQVRTFLITKLDAEKKKIEIQPGV